MNENSLTNSAEEFFKNSEQLDTKFNVLIKKTLNKEKVIFSIGIMLQILPQDKKSNDISNDKQKINELSNLAKEKILIT